jgi:cysteine desulfurase family protein (TIGR01976 family)
VDIHPEDGTLDVDDLRRQLSSRTRLVAVTCASNAVGTRTPITTIQKCVKEAGALLFLDAVHYAPHDVIDVQAWGCDFLACSAYKFYGPHVGILWGRRRLLEELTPYKLRPATESLPGRWMTGTQNHEGIAGVLAALKYLSHLGSDGAMGCTRRHALESAMALIREHEMNLALRLLNGLAERPRFKAWGLTDPKQMAMRVPTVAITAHDKRAEEIAEHLAQRQIFSWNGNMYAQELTERLALEDRGGVLRIGIVHYNTAAEVDRLLVALDEL